MYQIYMKAGMSLTMKGKSMNEQEFKQQLDNLVTNAINALGAGVVYGHLSTVKQFTEVVYDSNIVIMLQNLQAKESQEKGNLNDAG